MNEGVWKSFGLASTSSATGEENNFLFPDPDFDDAQSPWEENCLGKIVHC